MGWKTEPSTRNVVEDAIDAHKEQRPWWTPPPPYWSGDE